MFINLKEKNYNKEIIATILILYLVIAFNFNCNNDYALAGMIMLGASLLPIIIFTYFAKECIDFDILKSLVKNNNYAVVVINKVSEITFINHLANDLLKGMLPLEFIEKYISKEDLSPLLKLRSGFCGFFEVNTNVFLNFNDNKQTHLRICAKVINKHFYAFIIEDISANTAILETIAKENKFLDNFLNNIPSLLCVTDIEGKVRYANSYLLNELKFDEREILNKNIKNISNLKNHDLVSNNQQIISFITKDNKETDLVVQKSMHKIVGETFIYLSCLKLEQKTEKITKPLVNNHFAKLFTESPIGIVFCTNWGDIIDANFAMQKMLRLKDPLGSSILNYITLSDRSYFLSHLEKLTILQNIPYTTLNVEMVADDNENTKPISVLVYITPRRNENNESLGATLHFIDVTEEKKIMEQLQRSQKEQTFGMIASGVAHEVNNRIATIKMSADLLMMAREPSDPSYIEALKISEGVNRVKETVSALLFRLKKQESKKQYVPTEKIVSYYNRDYIRSILNPDIKDKITIITQFDNDLGYLRVDLTQIYNSIDNLLINASDAMSPKGGELFLKITSETFQKPFEYSIYNSTESVIPGDYVLIEVADTGCGIAEENLSKIFDHYYTTKQGMNFKNSGSGIGLSIVYGTIRQSEGYIMLKSKIGSGTSFKMLLPKLNSVPDDLSNNNKQNSNENEKIKTSKKKKTKINPQFSFDFDNSFEKEEVFDTFRTSRLAIAEESGTKILLIEDNDDIRFLAKKIISNLGYEVIDCDCAEMADDIIKKDKNFKLMLSDVMMPGMSGLDFLRIIKKEIPSIKVILMSGYSEGIINEEVTENETLKIISKPFSVSDLSSKIKDLIGHK